MGAVIPQYLLQAFHSRELPGRVLRLVRSRSKCMDMRIFFLQFLLHEILIWLFEWGERRAFIDGSPPDSPSSRQLRYIDTPNGNMRCTSSLRIQPVCQGAVFDFFKGFLK